jgi:hypothetical protein
MINDASKHADALWDTGELGGGFGPYNSKLIKNAVMAKRKIQVFYRTALTGKVFDTSSISFEYTGEYKGKPAWHCTTNMIIRNIKYDKP